MPRRLRHSSLVGPLALSLMLGLVGVARSQGPDPEDLSPGLILTAKSGGTVVRAIVPDLSFDWGNESPDPRVARDGFEVEATGFLLIQQVGEHRFGLESDGEVRLELDGQAIAPGAPVRPSPGPRRLSLRYRHGKGEARVKLTWEGPGFGREPVPARLLLHAAEDAPGLAKGDAFEQGRRLADRLGCVNCHAMLNLPAHPSIGPPLDETVAAIDPTWLVRKLSAGDAPHTGLSNDMAAQVVTFLTRDASKRKPPTAELRMGLNVADPARGRTLYRSIGCLGCHDDPESPSKPGAGSADLRDLKGKRSMTSVAEFLVHPRGAKSSRHRPSLKITPDEAAHLAAYLVPGPPPSPPPPAPGGDLAAGRALVRSHRCASCHEIPSVERTALTVPIRQPITPPGCLAEHPTGSALSRFHLTAEDRAALNAFVGALPQAKSNATASTLVADQVRRLGCLGCHSRDGTGGERLGSQLAAALATDPDLNRLKGTLTPPNLTAVADKLRPEALTALLSSKAPTPRPWLSVRMPQFDLTPSEIDRLARVWRSHDASPPMSAPTNTAKLAHDSAVTLIGQKGFGCLSCHVLAGKIPPGGEPETLGPDLALAPTRMTPAYFRRWLTNPQRILVGTPMPQFLKPIETLPGDLDSQRAAIWDLLSDPKLPALAALGTRQILKVEGDRAMVVRDMVLIDGLPGGPHVPRGLAIGFRNGRSLLFDTDRIGWVAAWKGGFLSRTKSGRLWEWHPEGTYDEPPHPGRLRAEVRDPRTGKGLAPTAIRERNGRFDEFEFVRDGVVLRYTVNLDAGGVRVEESIFPEGDALKWEVKVSPPLQDR